MTRVLKYSFFCIFFFFVSETQSTKTTAAAGLLVFYSRLKLESDVQS